MNSAGIAYGNSLWAVPSSQLKPCIHLQCKPHRVHKQHKARDLRCLSARTQVLLQALQPQPPVASRTSLWQSPVLAVVGAALLLLAALGFRQQKRNQPDSGPGTENTIPQALSSKDAQSSPELLEGASEQAVQDLGELTPQAYEAFDDQDWVNAQGLGRVVIVARRLIGLQGLQQQEEFYDQLLQSTQGPPPTGMLVAWRSCILIVFEGCNLQLLGLLRRALQATATEHGLLEPRVASYVLDCKSRLYNSWTCLDVPARDMGVPSVMSDEEWLRGIQDVDVFVKATGSQLSSLTKSALRQVMRDPQMFLGSTLPSPKVVLSLATTELGPSLDGFLESYDTDWRQYCAARTQLQAAGLTPDSLAYQPQWRMLHSVYGPVWDGEQQLKEANKEDQQQPVASPLAHLYPKTKQKAAKLDKALAQE